MSTTKRDIIAPMLLIGSMYCVLGFSLGVNAFFIPFVRLAFNVTTAMSYLIMTATFSAYLVFGGVSGKILKKAGYKGGIVIAFLIMAFGFLLIVPSAKMVNFPLFLVALFINGLGQALLTPAINTYVSIIGLADSAASRISGMGICNKTFYALASFALAAFMDLTNVRIEDAIVPFYVISAVLLLMGVFYYFSSLPEVKADGEEVNVDVEADTTRYSISRASIWQFPHLLLGVVAIFFTVGVEYLALGTINDYATILKLPSPENYVWFVSMAMIIGYLFGVIFIPKYVSQSRALLISTILGFFISLMMLIFPAKITIYLIPLLGLSNALLWPAVWPLAIADLGVFTKTGSSLLVTGIVGAAIVPLIFGFLAQNFSYQTAYAVGIPSYLFIMYYALWGNKIRIK